MIPRMASVNAMDHETYSDDYLRGILKGVRTIAMVGASEHWNRPSYFAMKETIPGRSTG